MRKRTRCKVKFGLISYMIVSDLRFLNVVLVERQRNSSKRTLRINQSRLPDPSDALVLAHDVHRRVSTRESSEEGIVDSINLRRIGYTLLERDVRFWADARICSMIHFNRSSVAWEINASTESSCAVIETFSHRGSFFTKDTRKTRCRQR